MSKKVEDHKVLISIKSFSNESFDQIKIAVKKISKEFEILRVSSVYEVEHRPESGINVHRIKESGAFEGLVVVIKVISRLTPAETLLFLRKVELTGEKVARRVVGINLLVFDDLTLMTPELTLPHPEFHRRAEELAPAAEIWGDYLHPILNVKISGLAKTLRSGGHQEFFAQGKSVLDF